MVTSLVRADEAFSNDELVAWLRRRLEDDVLDVIDEFETLTVVVTTDVWAEAHQICKEEPRLAFGMFDCLFGVDAGDDGFDVVSILYSVELGRRLLLRARVDGGREDPTIPTVTHLFRGADFHERETWDMFGIDFEGHDSLAPRILCDEHFEGWPLRKDFHLATREAKPWPGVKEPAETDEDGNIIEKVPGIGEAVGPMPLDELMAEQARAANPALVASEEEESDEDEAAQDGDADAVGDELKDDSERVEAAVLAEKTESGHADIAHHGGGDSSTDQVLANRTDNPDVRDPDQVRAEAAEHRAEKAREIAQDGLVTGTGEGEDVPQGDPNAFGGHGREPGETPTDLENVQDARERGELPDEAADTSGMESQNPTVEHSMGAGHGTDETVAAADEGYRGDEHTDPTTRQEALRELHEAAKDDGSEGSSSDDSDDEEQS